MGEERESRSANTNRFSPGARSLLAGKARRLRTTGVGISVVGVEPLLLQAMAKRTRAEEIREVLLRAVEIRAIGLALAYRWCVSLMRENPYRCQLILWSSALRRTFPVNLYRNSF